MIITRTPFRMSFFGGGTDFPEFYNEHGGSVISTTFDKYCYVTVRHLPPFFDYENELVYSKTERVNNVNDIQHPAIREAMKWLNIQNLRLAYDADLPARTGLGTSSSFAIGMLNAFYALQGIYADKYRLANDAIHLERVLCNENGGIQDQIAASFGGLNRIDFSSDGFVVNPIVISDEAKKEFGNNLLLYFTGFSRFSSDIQTEHKKNIKDKTSQLQEMLHIVDEAEKILTSSNKKQISKLGELLDYSWNLKRGISTGVSTDCIDALYQKAKSAGATGGKLLGAGGGGFLLFYVEEDAKNSVRAALSDLKEIPFQFENYGTRILHYSPEFNFHSV